MATLTATDYASMQNYKSTVKLLSGTVEECEARAEFYRTHKQYGFGNLRVTN